MVDMRTMVLGLLHNLRVSSPHGGGTRHVGTLRPASCRGNPSARYDKLIDVMRDLFTIPKRSFEQKHRLSCRSPSAPLLYVL